MSTDTESPEHLSLVDEQLRNSKTIAVVGLSDNPERTKAFATRSPASRTLWR